MATEREEEEDHAQKTIVVSSEDKFIKMFDELLGGWEQYKKLDARMKLLDASVKKYMVDNNMKSYERDTGASVIINQNRKVLDRSLIDDIEKYQVAASVKIMYKSPT